MREIFNIIIKYERQWKIRKRFVVVLYTVLVALVVITISFSVVYYNLLLDNIDETGCFLIDLPYYLPDFNMLSIEGKKNFLTFVLNLFVLVNTLLTVVIGLVSNKIKEHDMEMDTGIHKERIQERGKQDIDIMNQEFQGASYVTIFAGDFDWIIKNVKKGSKKSKYAFPPIYYTLKGLATNNKLRLFSDKAENTVKKTLGSEYKTFQDCIIYYKDDRLIENGVSIRCSKVMKNNNCKFLYSQTILENGEDCDYVFVIRKYKEGEYLIELIDSLLTSYSTAFAKSGKASENENNSI